MVALDRIPHRRPWLLLDRVVEIAGDVVTAEKRVSAGDPLVRGELPEVLLVEALAQAAACHGAAQASGAHQGMLVQLAGFTFDGRARPGDTVTLVARKTGAFGALHRFDGEARVGDRVIARGHMTFALT